MVIKSIGVFSVGKVMGILNAVMGLILGAFFALAGTLGLMAGAAANGDGQGGIVAILFGVGAIVILPIFYGVMGFIVGMIMALVYNVVAGIVGGIELVVDQ